MISNTGRGVLLVLKEVNRGDSRAHRTRFDGLKNY